MTSAQNKRAYLSDRSLWILLISNLFTIVLAVSQNISYLSVVWAYFFQGIIITTFSLIRVMQLKNFSTEGLIINGKPASATESSKITLVAITGVVFGVFTFGQFLFLLILTIIKSSDQPIKFSTLGFIFLSGIAFFLCHLFSFYYNKGNEIGVTNLASAAFEPLKRIFPMQFAVILGFFFVNAGFLFNTALPFLAIKTLFDCWAHINEHAVKNPPDASSIGTTQP